MIMDECNMKVIQPTPRAAACVSIHPTSSGRNVTFSSLLRFSLLIRCQEVGVQAMTSGLHQLTDQ